MRGVRVNSNGTSTKGLVELKNHVQSEQKNGRDGAKGGGQGNSDEEESRINNDVNSNTGPKDLIQRPQGPQGSAVSWQRFLPFGSLKVLLVEFDDSTRHVVSALLRNCSYEVTAVSNCIEAWKILEDLTSHIDLVLTEVAMPYISGISLLSKIMNHKTCKNIPVIMMSANDSMGIVFKCLSKGAVDFLVKPIRKNELKNLWQHVWRKCHSSCGSGSGSGSGSESGIRTQKSSKSKSVEGTGNNNVSNGEDDNGSLSLNDKNGSDNGSGTQSSWTKRAVEVDSPKHTSPWEELADAPDSTCAQVMDLSPEEVTNNWVLTTATRELVENIESGDVAMGKDLGIGVPISSDLQIENESKEASLPISAALKRRILESETENSGAILQEDKIQLKDGNSNDNSREEVADLIGVINSVSPQMDVVAAVLPSDISKNMKDECLYDPKEIPSVELSLKRPRDVAELEVSVREQNVLRRSNLSAFSRYNTIPTATPTGIVGSCSPPDNSSEAEKTGNLLSNSNGTPNQRSNGSSNNNDMGSTTNNTFAVPESSDKTVPKSAVNARPCSVFQSVRNGHPPLQPIIPRKGEDVTVNTIPAQDNGKSSQVQVQHHHHHYHHYHHHVHNSQQKKAAKAVDSSLRTMAGPPSLPTPVEGNAANYSLNGSGSGSYNGSNGQNGSGTAVFTEGANINNENGLAANSGPGADGGSGSGSGSWSGVDQSRHAHREAALNKFRLKRKERCFDKKVRYQSRKKLAEQRPRVRGQFVRQGVYENKSNDTDC